MQSVICMVEVALALVVCATSLPTRASEPQRDVPPEAGLASENTPSVPGIVQGMGPAIGATELDKYRGGTGIVVNDMRLNGTVADNTAVNVLTGANTITESSFANASGLTSVIQNTGANVLIQNATILNVQFK